MGADVSPEHIFKAVSSLPSDSTFVFFGTSDFVVRGHEFILCQDVVTMHDSPSHALRQKGDSSLFTAIRALKDGTIDALISAANTGALLAGARSILEHFPNCTRPPLACFIRAQSGEDVLLLDVGASPEASDELLCQYAQLGAACMQALQNKKPTVALLNIGEEPIKGTSEQKGALKLLQENPSSLFDFIGNKEPYDIFAHTADVFVTNGLIGNLFLKSCEAVIRFLAKDIPSQEKGAMLLGVNNLILKCHGKASEAAIQRTVLQTEELLSQNIIPKLRQLIA